ncbi:sugar ABC transporter substrate-binding protein [Arthrobacter sp. Leaf234]|uniref:sugar ABC transporter substrate-binding protein n=1 Tax=Arthrobacter sp. Leaf234 TaxID=1736303 RepID=UPI0006F6F2B5|nr:extracellular solute-binding protein [Arthrobacter sp. Leaf234]KQO03658.1 sugar ABC transporter substrate-binding protein [Arthrobacter sp. Leaf234]
MTTGNHRTPRRLAAAALVAAGALTLSACSGGSGFSDAGEGSGDQTEPTDAPLTVLIGSSGTAETDAVTSAVSDWSGESGIEATVNVASDLPQQLSQGFASGDPADVFYVSADAFAGYAANGSLEPYAEDLAAKDDFYPALREAFTYEDTLYCAPKDFSTLGLVINDQLWSAAGLTDEDIPTTWDELADTAATLTKDGTTGLAFSPEFQRVGAFAAAAGGGLVTDGEATANSTENVEALTYVQQLLDDGVAAYSSDLGAGWGGEAFGKGQAAMVIEGNWIAGAMSADYPDVEYSIAELPEGPAGKGTLQFTNCWGIAADSENIAGARELVEQLTSADSQLAFAQAFGVMPSIQSAADQWSTEYPDLAPFIAGGDYAQNVPAQPGAVDVIAELNAQLESLRTADPQQLLDGIQPDLEAVLADAR